MKNKNNGLVVNNENQSGFWGKIFKVPYLFFVIFVTAIAYLTAYVPSKSLPQLIEGEIATSDIITPADLTIEDKETTENRRKEAEDAILPVYNLDPNVFLNTDEKIREFFSTGQTFSQEPIDAKNIDDFNQSAWEKYGFRIPADDLRSLSELNFNAVLEETLINLIGKISSIGITLTKSLFIHGEQEKGLTLIVSQGNEKSTTISEILDINESKVRLSEEINRYELSQNEKSLLILLSHLFISPNITFSPMESDARKLEARESVEIVFSKIKKGKVIIRKGDEIGLDTLKQIEIINQNLSDKPSWLSNFAGSLLLFGLVFLALQYYVGTRFEAGEALKYYIMMGTTLLLSLLIYKGSLFLAELFSQNTGLPLFAYAESYRYAFPFQIGALLFCYLSGLHLALIFTVINSILVGYLLQTDFYFLIFVLIGGLSAILGVRYFGKQSRTPVLRTSLFLVAPINIIIIITFHLIREKLGPIEVLSSELIMGIIGGLISGALAFLLLPVFENLFQFITQNKLLEITNSELPIFRKMAMEAPGSYHHSLVVASLAETAAEEIGLDPLLVKAGALYHDIGKIKRPEYFIENKTRNFDLHKDLKPSMSTLVIVNHIKEGLEKAHKLKLPKKVRQMIEQHHGTTLVRYFFEKAKEEYDPEMQTIGEESYRYVGPIPQSKEAALIMMADSIEAASRSLSKPTKPTLQRLITDILNNYIQDSQLDNSNFSLKELKIIAASLLGTLYTIYHPRVEYPGFDFERKGKNSEKPKSTHDRNHKSAK